MVARIASSSLLALALLVPLATQAQVSISIGIAPPPLPVYRQPPPPADGYLWTPGYWAWNEIDGGYYWVPGTWVLAPRPGYLWTPGYWTFIGTSYRWNRGYWGPRVGFYGGIDYGFGYTGRGYHGGRWDRGVFHYNTAVNNVNTTVVRNVYKTEVVNNTTYKVRRVSYNGGAGAKAAPTAEERQARQAQVVDPTPNQVEHERKALKAPTQKAAGNDGAPRVVATTKAAALDAPDAVRGSDRAAGDPPRDKAAVPPEARAGAKDRERSAAPARSAVGDDADPADKAAAAKNSSRGSSKEPARDAKATGARPPGPADQPAGKAATSKGNGRDNAKAAEARDPAPADERPPQRSGARRPPSETAVDRAADKGAKAQAPVGPATGTTTPPESGGDARAREEPNNGERRGNDDNDASRKADRAAQTRGDAQPDATSARGGRRAEREKEPG